MSIFDSLYSTLSIRDKILLTRLFSITFRENCTLKFQKNVDSILNDLKLFIDIEYGNRNRLFLFLINGHTDQKNLVKHQTI